MYILKTTLTVLKVASSYYFYLIHLTKTEIMIKKRMVNFINVEAVNRKHCSVTYF